ncbi:MAG TPA: hypothetical protein VEG31_03905 [Thermoproteota archaeon]|nr:hypothetical protein [Thermoproteota archaeon]
MGDRDLTRSGFLSFASSLFSLVTGLLFSVVVARRLSITEYGVWQYYLAVIAYLVLPGATINFWLTRELGRGKGSLSTGLIMNGLVSAVSGLLLLLIWMVSGSVAEVGPEIILALILYTLLLYMANSLDSAAVGASPSLYGIGRFVLEVVKVFAAAVLVVWLRMGLLAALLSIDLAILAKCVVMYLRMPRTALGKADLSLGFLWLRRWLIPVLGVLPGLLASADLLILALITGSTVPTAYLGVARTISEVVAYSGLLSISLYPLLLSGRTGSHVEESMRMVSMLAFPMVGGLIALALPILYVYGPSYSPAVISLQLLSVAALIGVAKEILVVVLQGTEKVDTNQDASLLELTKSNLAMPRLIELAASCLYILACSVVTYLLKSWEIPDSSIVAVLTLMYLLMAVSLLLIVWNLSKKVYKYAIPWSNLTRYAAATAVMVVTVLIFYPAQAISTSISEVLINLLPVVAAGAVVYFVVLLVIDQTSRNELRELYDVWRAGRKGPASAGSPSRG